MGRVALVAGAIAATMVVGPSPPAGAAVIEVTTTADGGPGSLRDAFAQASVAVEPTEIVLADAFYVLDDCAEGDLAHTGTQPLTITGDDSVIRQTCPGERVIATDGDLTMVEVNLGGGDLAAGIGGGIEADTADVTLIRSEVVGNNAPIGAGVAAIRVTAVESTVSGNVAGSVGGGIWADQVADLTNSTVANNQAGSSGGGIAVVNTSVVLTHATIADNEAPVGANIELQQGSDALESFASVIADPEGGSDCAIDAGATTISHGYNVETDGTCGFGGAPGDVDGGFDVELGPLADNGGGTATQEPLPGSFLIDLVECGFGPVDVTTDQRGVTRAQGTACDVGAVEVEVVVPPSTTDSTPTTDPGPAPPAVPVTGPATFTG
ncbi:MAG TPA: choice-of-anchor Q domain-containing protein [Iamia sp.]